MNVSKWYYHDQLSMVQMIMEEATASSVQLQTYLTPVGNGIESYTEVSYRSDKLNRCIIIDGDGATDIESVDELAELIEGWIEKAREIEENISYDNS